MKLLPSLFCILLLFQANIIYAGQERVALVIGNADYAYSPLENPVHDANDMAGALKKCGFNVTKIINATRSQMRRGIREFGDHIKRGGIGLFFYAGHGIQVNGENYLVPIGADVQRKYDVEDQCLNAGYVLGAMEEAGNNLNIIILDACRNNPFRSYRSSRGGLAQMSAPSGSIVAFATSPGSVAADGTGQNGLYTSKLLKHLLKPGQRLLDLFINVRNDVADDTGNVQIPWENHSLRAPFYFVPPKNTPSPTSSSKKIPKAQELEAQRKKLAEEKATLHAQQQVLEEQKLLLEARTLLEKERKKLIEEKKRLAALRKTPPPKQNNKKINVTVEEKERTKRKTKQIAMVEDKLAASAKNQDNDKNAIILFFQNYFRAYSSADVERLMTFYADDKVNFYSAGRVSKNFIKKDKKNYYKRWPRARQAPASDFTIKRHKDGQQFDVVFDIRFLVENKTSKISGKARNTFTLRKKDNSFLIISEKQKVLKRVKRKK